MAKRTKLPEFEKGEITALKRVGKSQTEISKALGHRKNIICNYFNCPNKYGTRKLTGRPEKLSLQYKRRMVLGVKKNVNIKTLKFQVDAYCTTRKIKSI